MFWHDSQDCAICGTPSRVYRTAGNTRYRKCRNPACKSTWRTQEVLQKEADELTVLYQRQLTEAMPLVEAIIEEVERTFDVVRERLYPIPQEAKSGNSTASASR